MVALTLSGRELEQLIIKFWPQKPSAEYPHTLYGREAR